MLLIGPDEAALGGLQQLADENWANLTERRGAFIKVTAEVFLSLVLQQTEVMFSEPVLPLQ